MDNQTNPPYTDPYQDVMSNLKNNQPNKPKKSLLKIATFIVAPTFVFLMLLSTLRGNAATMTSRSLTLGSSVASATGVTYTFDFTVPSATQIKSLKIDICTTASSGACDPTAGTGVPAGFDCRTATSCALVSTSNFGTGDAFAIDLTANINQGYRGSLRMKRTNSTGAPSGAQQVKFSGITNPGTTNTTFFARITTYSDSAYTTAIDSGVVASSTAGQVTVTASIDESLSFQTGSTEVALGTLSTSSTKYGTSTLQASTNASNGYTITATGTTLTSSDDSIAAMSVGGTSATNTNQFGINLVVNTVPPVGANVDNVSNGTTYCGHVDLGYGTANNFKFVVSPSSNGIASSSCPSLPQQFTVSYIANITAIKKPGNYTATLNYVMTAAF